MCWANLVQNLFLDGKNDGEHEFWLASSSVKVPLGRKFIGLFRPNSVAEYRVLFIFLQKTEQQTFHPNIF